MEQTIFHKILAGEISCHTVYESDQILAFLDIMPCTVGHTIVIPKDTDSVNMIDASPATMDAVFGAVHGIAHRIAQAVGATGFNIAMNNGSVAGQAVMYPHVHIIPRRAGDGLEHWPKIERSQEELARDAEQIRSTLS